jgi:N-acetyl-anhydromuramyl-L-alanine amidase AmpD
MNPVAKASAHFVVSAEGKVIQVVGLDERAWHVGQGRFPVNGQELQVAVDRSGIGIEMVNHGLLSAYNTGGFFFHVGKSEARYDAAKFGQPIEATLDFIDNVRSPDVSGWWAPYPQRQLEAVVQLCEALREEFNIPLQRIVGHEDVAYPQGRKIDPGPLWPWQMFMDMLAGTKSKQCMPLPEDVWALHKTRR